MHNKNIICQLNDSYHEETFKENWIKNCGNGNKKLDEIQIFLKFLENQNTKIDNIEFFNKNFKYKEYDVEEPGDLQYLGQIYQIMNGNCEYYFYYQKKKNNQLKSQKNNGKKEAFLVKAPDYALSDEDRLKSYSKDLSKKEANEAQNIILLIRYNHRNKPEASLKIMTGWQDVILVFDNGNLSIKKFKIK